jgi:hypothetical protein
MTISPEDLKKLPFSSGIEQPIAKWIGTRPPFPVYAMPFRFRGEDRTLEYALFVMDDKTVGSASWLRCIAATEDQRDPWFACDCCPEFTTVEDLDVLAAVAADVAKPGDPLLPEDCR